jgi:hypothetical protein
MLAAMPKNTGGRPGKNQSHDTTGLESLKEIAKQLARRRASTALRQLLCAPA